MRALLPVPAEEVDLHDHYAQDWLTTGGIRANFISSVDGAASANGKSAGLQTRGDNKVFAALRDLADVVLVGAGTAIAEGYAPVALSERRQGVRRDRGLSIQLPTAVVSRTLRLDPDAELFAGRTGPRTLVLTSGAADADVRAALTRHADVIDCGDDDVEPAAVRAALTERGFTRVLAEGGPTVFAQLVRGGVVDELCLSVSPMLVGPGPGRVSGGNDEWADPARLGLLGLLEEDGALFARYAVS